MGDRTFSLDANLLLSDGGVYSLSSTTVPTVTQVSGANGLLDLTGTSPAGFGGSGSFSVLGASDSPRFDGCCVVLLSAYDTSLTTAFKAILQGCQDPSFTSGAVENLAQKDWGLAGSRDGGTGVAITTHKPSGFVNLGQGLMQGDIYEMPFTNDVAGVKYKYVRLVLLAIVGSPVVTLTAYIAPLTGT